MKRFASKYTLACCALMLGLILNSNANADLAIEFSTDGGLNFDNDLELSVGATETIEVYLTDSDPFARIAFLGLQSFQIRVDTDTSISTISSSTLQAPYGEVDGGGSFQAAGSFAWDATTPDEPTPGSQILLGNFTVLGTGAGQTVFTASDISPGSNGWVLGDASGTDADIFGVDGTGTFSFTVVAVPEPSSMLVGLGLIAFGASRRRRR